MSGLNQGSLKALAEADVSSAAELLEQDGDRMLAAAGASHVLELLGTVAPADMTKRLHLLRGEALALCGHIESARAVYDMYDDGGVLDPSLARLVGHLEYKQGRPAAALAAYERGRFDRGTTAPEALLLAWMSTAHWALGNQDECRQLASSAWRVAGICQDSRALAAAHVALGFAAEMRGEAAAEQSHYERALEIAETAGDLVECARIRTNLSSRLLGEGRFADALAVGEIAVRQAETVDYRTVLGLALCNSGDALKRLGRLDEAFSRFEQALAVEHRNSSQRLAYPLSRLGDVYRLRGRTNLALAAYEEAVRMAVERQGLVPALTGLAVLLTPSDPVAAKQFALRARALAVGPAVIRTVLALGWAEHTAGQDATNLAAEAAELARLHRDKARLAEALELVAATSPRPAAARRALMEARDIWRDTGARLDELRVSAVLGTLPDAHDTERALARVARACLASQGIRLPGSGEAVTVRTLGRFEVRVAGEPVAAWQSRKARDLLRILIVRRGRGIAREELGRLLWGEDSGKVAHRLSVALSTLRTTLDPQLIVADQATVALDRTKLTLDIEDFFLDAEEGLRRTDRTMLTAAESAYTGDLFEDEPYDDWAVSLREQARATYLRVARTLVRLAPDVDEAVHYLHRLLAKDPYDEQAHADLVDTLTKAGRHGEAARARTRFTQAMHQLMTG
ncbi:DNA-binding SARP family transcriptional activator/predicted negative regulator of RcsB-dependent stress response [Kibdelosporangium banguiense]|uniref:DNA-binding SARP family transcriptional activator/predicted negative regulator of RcsB-dependent stress response n=1 Tax=Kibdelosporangium banguiense TaxID=1365924 RepID=A0ABS4U1Q0_9PSEU|nr:tetratricopeptide repeat protein [Kibdelosporangium banguiense]MBP2330565.1 DNA-binding SARP family transcriptional activator/predicted negative regulator of RcsB-dependent stress response [Kibdelosporangium banguiense]